MFEIFPLLKNLFIAIIIPFIIIIVFFSKSGFTIWSSSSSSKYKLTRKREFKSYTVATEYESDKKIIRYSDDNDEDSQYISRHSKYIKIRGKSLRVFHIPHESGSSVPMMFFIHGLGGQIVQFVHQLNHFSQVANVLAIDLVGFGYSEQVEDETAYTTDSIVEDLLETVRLYTECSSLALICHSYGTRLGVKLLHRLKERKVDVAALILLAPKSIMSEHEKKIQQKIPNTPNFLVEIMRFMDRLGGIKSVSVQRMIGSSGTEELKRKQLEWNKFSSTTSLKKLLKGMKWAEPSEYASINAPILLIGAEEDKVTPVKPHAEDIYKWILKGGHCPYVKKYIVPQCGHNMMCECPEICNALIYNFLISKCNIKEMSREEQIKWERYDPKWSLKNYEKWKAIQSISPFVGQSKFRPMKTLKEDDHEHAPLKLIQENPDLGLIIDISKDEPTYNTLKFNESMGCRYVKLATISKVPPSEDDALKFIETARRFWQENPEKSIGVHCHYGFNRTGFVICCYLIEEMKMDVQEAIDAFGAARPPGIRHNHFKDELVLRYSIERSPLD